MDRIDFARLRADPQPHIESVDVECLEQLLAERGAAK